MKNPLILCIAAFLLAASFSVAQVVPPVADKVSPAEWQRERSESIALADKLYPELKTAGSRLEDFIGKIFPDSNLFPNLAKDSFAPLFYANVAAQQLGVSAQWQTLTDSEKALVFQEIAYHSKLVYLTVCAESRQIASLTTSRPQYVSPVTSSFNPDAISNPGVRQMFDPNKPQAPLTQPPMTGATENGYFLPPTKTTIDPQSGDVTITQH